MRGWPSGRARAARSQSTRPQPYPPAHPPRSVDGTAHARLTALASSRGASVNPPSLPLDLYRVTVYRVTVLKYSTVRRSPSSKATSGEYPSSRLPFDTSARVWGTSPGRGGTCLHDRRRPRIASSFAIISSRLTRSPQPTLNTSPPTPAVRAASRLASTTLSIYVKSRDWAPSPWTSRGFPRRPQRMNRGTTAAYSDFGS